MPLSDEDKLEIREQIRYGFKDALKEQGITLANHSAHHKWIADFINTCSTIRKAAIYSTVGIIITAVVSALWLGIKTTGG